MKVLAYVHLYPPTHNAGAEIMLHTLLRDLVKRGHEVRVLSARHPTPIYVYEQVTVSSGRPSSEISKWYSWADVAITHLDFTRQAVSQAKTHRVPLVHIVHNDRQLTFHGVTPEAAQLVIFNSEWIARKVGWSGPSVVIRPPVIASDYRTRPGDALTLVNLSASKGAELFYELARRLPGRKFLGVKGAYARQIMPMKLPPNVEIIENTPDIRDVYSKTRVLLMPSDYESWGRVGIEAAASGIPTIAHPTPGLVESLGTAGIFADRANVNEWMAAIASLDVPAIYRARSAAARARSDELDPTAELDLFERRLQELTGDR